MHIISLNYTGKYFYVCEKKLRGLPVSEKSNPILEYIKMDVVKIESEITKGRNMCGKSCLAKQDGLFSQI